jgi:hypothetical protein
MRHLLVAALIAGCFTFACAQETKAVSRRAMPANRVMGLCTWTTSLGGALKSGKRLETLFGEKLVGTAIQNIDCFAQPTSNQLTRTKLYESLENFAFVDADATLVFYYLGHGVLLRRGDALLKGAWPEGMEPSANDTTFEHCLALDCDEEDERFVPRSVVRNKLEANNAGLVVFITDSCSVPFRHADTEVITLGGEKRNKIYEDLFLNSRGFVEINSSSFQAEKAADGRELLIDFEWAACPGDGAVFSNSFVEMFFPEKGLVLDTNGDNFIGWNEAYNHLLGEVAKNDAVKRRQLRQSRRLFPADNPNSNVVWLLQKTQTPMFFGTLLDYVAPK